MNVLTAGYMDPVDAFLVGVVPGAVVAVACFGLRSYWLYAFTLHGGWEGGA